MRLHKTSYRVYSIEVAGTRVSGCTPMGMRAECKTSKNLSDIGRFLVFYYMQMWPFGPMCQSCINKSVAFELMMWGHFTGAPPTPCAIYIHTHFKFHSFIILKSWWTRAMTNQCLWLLQVSMIGYHTMTAPFQVSNGSVTRLDITLHRENWDAPSEAPTAHALTTLWLLCSPVLARLLA